MQINVGSKYYIEIEELEDQGKYFEVALIHTKTQNTIETACTDDLSLASVNYIVEYLVNRHIT